MPVVLGKVWPCGTWHPSNCCAIDTRLSCAFDTESSCALDTHTSCAVNTSPSLFNCPSLQVRPGLGAETARYLSVTQLDDLWCDHLERMNLLKESVSMEVSSLPPVFVLMSMQVPLPVLTLAIGICRPMTALGIAHC